MHKVEEDFLHFAHAKNYEERKRILRNSLLVSHDLRNPKVILEFIDNAFDDANSKKNLLEHYNLIIQIRENGPGLLVDFHSYDEIELAFIEFSNGYNILLERKKFLNNNLYLLSDKSISVVDSLIFREIYKYNLNIITNLKLYRNLLKACRLLPIDEAFKDFEVPEERFVNALNTILAIQSPFDISRILGIYSSEVRDPMMRNVFMFFLARFQDNPEKVERLKAAWDLISSFQSSNELLWFESTS